MTAAKVREKHLPYYALRDAFLASAESGECALCSVEKDRLRRYLTAVLDEQVNDPALRAELARAHGYCRAHAHLLLTLGDALGATILYLDQVREARKLFRRLQARNGPRDPGLRRAAKAWLDGEACPACRYLEKHRRRLLDVLADGLEETEMRAALEKAAPLCLPHFFAALRRVSENAHRQFLIARQEAGFAAIQADLEEFYRKQDYRFRHEPLDRERNAWLRAVAGLTGAPELFPRV